MDKIKVLEEIGLKKVCDETHIEQKYLKFMIDMEYEKLDHINTLGFVKILSREYKLDLSAWTEAFEEYWVENRLEEEDKGLFIVVDDEKSNKKLLIFVLLVFVVVTFSMLFSVFQDKIDLSNYIDSEKISYEQTPIVQEAQESLDEANNSFEDQALFDDTNSTVKDIEVVDHVNKEVLEEKKIEKIEKIEKDEKLEAKMKEDSTEKVSQRFSQEAILIPNSQLWVGVIYLDTKKRRSFLGEGNFSIDTSREQIITTGHGSFSLIVAGERREFHRKSPIRFLVKNSNITQIKWNKFKELNEGKSW